MAAVISAALDKSFAVAVALPQQTDIPQAILTRSFGIVDDQTAGMATRKVLELLHVTRPSKFIATPQLVTGPYAARYQGGVMLASLAVGISGFAQQVDKLLACLALYTALFPSSNLTFHHVGLACVDLDQWNSLGLKYIHRPSVRSDAKDHARRYISFDFGAKGSNGKDPPYVELQYWPEGPEHPGEKHLDFSVIDISHLLDRLREWMTEPGVTFDTWEADANSPTASVRTAGERSNGTFEPLEVMFRPHQDVMITTSNVFDI